MIEKKAVDRKNFRYRNSVRDTTERVKQGVFVRRNAL